MENNLKSKPILFVLSSPSGGGKTSLSKKILHEDKKIKLAISATTRLPRNGEKDGIDYHFMSNNQFNILKQQKKFFETTEIYNASYGTLVSTAEQALNDNRDTLFIIDWVGALALKNLFPEQVVTIFIIPPNFLILEQRLMKRESRNNISLNRLAKAKSEIQYAFDYDYFLINNDITESVANLQSVIKAERIKLSRFINLKEYLENF